MGVGPLIAWRRASSAALRRHFLWPLVIGIGGAAIFFLLGIRQTLALLAFGLALFVTSTMVVDFTKGTRARMKTGEGLLMAMTRLALRQNRRYGGFVVHLGVLLVLVGITGSQLFALHTETTVALGEEVRIGRYALRFQGLQATEESNHFKVTGRFVVFNNRHPVAEMFPAKKFYPQEQQPIAHVAYRSGLFEDLYLVMGDFTRDGQSATVRAMVNPLVSWIWIGGLVLTLGAALAILPDHRRAAS
jgi:cytochrome c-type biogenesis protein CcmF